MIRLSQDQRDAVNKLKNGNILCGGVGSGKSRTAIAYYYVQNGGNLDIPDFPMQNPQDLYIITTARKRDKHEWDLELVPFLMSIDIDIDYYHHKVIVDSWNNIKKYANVKDAFFIFDEQRVVGYGAWTKAFIKITEQNKWILLSATPGDRWIDYMPVFIANGFYKNKTDFCQQHVIYNRFAKYEKVDRYVCTNKLYRLRNQILVDIKFDRKTISHIEYIICSYDISEYKNLMKNRWNRFTNKPIKNAAELCFQLRKLVNSDSDRICKLLDIYENHKKIIVFYNYIYELDILKEMCSMNAIPYAEWNGQKHEEIPSSSEWIYFVQYTAGCEGWNCIETDTMIFFSQNYSYKVMEQAKGRIDRRNTPFTDLYYYIFRSNSSIDLSISRAIRTKKKFNENKFIDISDAKFTCSIMKGGKL